MEVCLARQELASEEIIAFSKGPASELTLQIKNFSQNLDFSTFPYLCERTYRDMISVDSRVQKILPYCALLHVATGVLNAVLISIIEAEDVVEQYAPKGSAQNHFKDLILPAPIADYIGYVANTTTAELIPVALNVPRSAIPTVYTPEDEENPMIPGGTFGPVNDHNHNLYECYVSPYVTRKFLQACKESKENWDPLPSNLIPENAVPNKNLLGYSEIEYIHDEAKNILRNIDFPNEKDQTIDARLQWSSELVINVQTALQSMKNKYKMRKISLDENTIPGMVTYIEVKQKVPKNAYIVPLSPTIWSSEPSGSEISNISYYLGLKRKRNENAPGPCYTKENEEMFPGWIEHINDNFMMVGDFQPAFGVDAVHLRSGIFSCIAPDGVRGVKLHEYFSHEYRKRPHKNGG